MPKNRMRARRKSGVIALSASLLALGLLLGCAGPPEEVVDDRPLVLTTFTVLADMARVVGGDAVRVESITKVGAEIHGYEPTPSDLRNAARADLILDNGLGLERWFERFVESVDAPHVVLSDGVEAILIRAGDYEGLPNPHAWMSPVQGGIYVDNIVQALSSLVPSQRAEFESRGADYKAELAELAAQFAERIAGLDPEHRMLVTCEGAFSYLARDLGLDEAYLWPVNSDTQGTPGQIAAVITLVREREVPAVFCETTVNAGAQRQVAAETGAHFGELLYVDSLSEAGGPVPSYLELLRYDVEAIATGLAG